MTWALFTVARIFSWLRTWSVQRGCEQRGCSHHPASSYNGGVLQQALDIALFEGSHLVKVPVSKGSSKAVTLLEDQFPGEATLGECQRW